MVTGIRRWASRMGMLAMACVLFLAGCAQATYDNSLSPAQNELRAANARFTNTVATGAVAGAVLGAGAGALLAGRNNRAQGALIGAAAGGALGAGAGYAVASNNARQTRSEDSYNSAIQEAQGEADAYRRSAVASASIANEAETKLRTLNAQYAAKQISADAFRAQLANYRSDLEILNKQVADSSKTSASMRTDARSAGRGRGQQLASTASEIERSNSELRNNASRISRVLAASPVGA